MMTESSVKRIERFPKAVQVGSSLKISPWSLVPGGSLRLPSARLAGYNTLLHIKPQPRRMKVVYRADRTVCDIKVPSFTDATHHDGSLFTCR